MAASPAPTAVSSPMAREILAAHNAVRARVGQKPLVWSNQLASYAQEWADHLLATGAFQHRSPHPYGENLFETDGGRSTPAEVVRAWASESKDYDYRSNGCRSVCGHYTQIVWASTRKVGCAVAHLSWREVWVCNYDPPGNFVGQRPY